MGFINNNQIPFQGMSYSIEPDLLEMAGSSMYYYKNFVIRGIKKDRDNPNSILILASSQGS